MTNDEYFRPYLLAYWLEPNSCGYGYSAVDKKSNRMS